MLSTELTDVFSKVIFKVWTVMVKQSHMLSLMRSF